MSPLIGRVGKSTVENNFPLSRETFNPFRFALIKLLTMKARLKSIQISGNNIYSLNKFSGSFPKKSTRESLLFSLNEKLSRSFPLRNQTGGKLITIN